MGEMLPQEWEAGQSRPQGFIRFHVSLNTEGMVVKEWSKSNKTEGPSTSFNFNSDYTEECRYMQRGWPMLQIQVQLFGLNFSFGRLAEPKQCGTLVPILRAALCWVESRAGEQL